VAVLNGSTLYFLHDDRLGTPQVASDNSQNIQWQASYEPFGTTPSMSGTITQNLRFPGQYFDVESGWSHNGFRDYVPGQGRYIEPDPLDRMGSGNDLYVYAGDNPERLIDPLGLCTPCSQVPTVNVRAQWYSAKDISVPGLSLRFGGANVFLTASCTGSPVCTNLYWQQTVTANQPFKSHAAYIPFNDVFDSSYPFYYPPDMLPSSYSDLGGGSSAFEDSPVAMIGAPDNFTNWDSTVFHADTNLESQSQCGSGVVLRTISWGFTLNMDGVTLEPITGVDQ
jgi:RHS repeat-associated protein